jgi:hypothetical protein
VIFPSRVAIDVACRLDRTIDDVIEALCSDEGQPVGRVCAAADEIWHAGSLPVCAGRHETRVFSPAVDVIAWRDVVGRDLGPPE